MIEPTRQSIIDVIGIGLVALILLIATRTITESRAVIGHRHLRAIADNDAVGYATAARSLAKTGKLTSHIIYPSTLTQKATKTTLYMPGVYLALAAVYKLFGYGTAQSLGVSGAGYIVAAICTYLIGQRCFDRRTGILAAILFLIYPANLYFSATAMTELPLVAAAAVALCIFVHLPYRAMPWVGPVLLLLPFLFRETGAFLALPMAILLLFPPKPQHGSIGTNLARAAIFLGLSILLLGAVYVSPVASGRPSLIKLDIFIQEKGAERIYRDALAFDELKPTPRQWKDTLTRRFRDNVRTLMWRANRQQHEFFIIVLVPLLAAVPLGLIWGTIKRDPLALGAAFLLLLTLGFVCMFYSVRHDRPLRVAMFAFPLVALLEARLVMALVSAGAPRIPEPLKLWTLGILVISLAAWVFTIASRGFTDMTVWDLADERGNRLIESLKIPELDGKTTLIAPHLLGVPYLNQHPDITYCFVPANRQTLELVCSRYDVSTLIYHPDDALDLTHTDIKSQGFYLYRRIQMEGLHYYVYRRPAFAGQELTWKVLAEEQFIWNPRQTVRY